MNPSLVESHDDALDVAALAEELVELLLGGVVGEVADVQRRALPQQLLLLVPGPLEMLVPVRAQVHSGHRAGGKLKVLREFLASSPQAERIEISVLFVVLRMTLMDVA